MVRRHAKPDRYSPTRYAWILLRTRERELTCSLAMPHVSQSWGRYPTTAPWHGIIDTRAKLVTYHTEAVFARQGMGVSACASEKQTPKMMATKEKGAVGGKPTNLRGRIR